MSILYEPSDRFPTGILHINLLFGRNLSGQEISRPAELLGNVRKADPYVVVTYEGRKAPRSKVCSAQGPSPEWNQHFYFPIRDGNTAALEKTSSISGSRTRLSKLFTNQSSSVQNILEYDTLEIKVSDKNNFRHDYAMGKVRIPNLPRVITSTPNWYLEKQPFPVLVEVKGELVSAGELWMEIGFEVVDESEFDLGWLSDPSVDGKMHVFSPLPLTPVSSLAHFLLMLSCILTDELESVPEESIPEESVPQVAEVDNGTDHKRRIKELLRENSRLSQKVAALQSQLTVSEEDTAALETKLTEAVDQISALDARNKELDDKVARLERQFSELQNSSG
ncbi:hypothetical protein R1sor_021540 [Riccia sorocarpa]|uniref:C2 domain-containing protein n=1 Tax=Riccia sorocarpa TaxID=122646 RepID=A0ABD3GJH7_9MARC